MPHVTFSPWNAAASHWFLSSLSDINVRTMGISSPVSPEYKYESKSSALGESYVTRRPICDFSNPSTIGDSSLIAAADGRRMIQTLDELRLTIISKSQRY